MPPSRSIPTTPTQSCDRPPRSTAPPYPTAEACGWTPAREDVLAVFKDERFVKDWRKVITPEQLAQIPPIPDVMKPLSQNMLDTDPPDHERLRALVSKAFTPRLIERMRPCVQAIADVLLDAVEDRGEMDLIDDYAFPLPITVIAELLGVPAEDRDSFREWSDAAVLGSAYREIPRGGPHPPHAGLHRLPACSLRGEARRVQGRPHKRAGAGGASRRHTLRGRAARHGLPAARCGARDNRQSHQQRYVGAAAAPRTASNPKR